VAEDIRILRLETTAQETDIRSSSVARRVRWKELMRRYAGKVNLDLAREFEADHFDAFWRRTHPGGRSLCGHFELDAEPAGPWPGVPFGTAGTIDGKVLDAKMARQMSFLARWGAACGRAFDARRYLEDHPQFDWMRDILKSRPSQPWTKFSTDQKN
jgi:hypothetical protein